jgi:hypothetical protein
MTLIEIGHHFAVAKDGLIWLYGSNVLPGGAMANLTLSQDKANG